MPLRGGPEGLSPWTRAARTHPSPEPTMARWPRHTWTSLFTYLVMFVLFPLLCLLAYLWVRGELL
jgi:hypothetical protein